MRSRPRSLRSVLAALVVLVTMLAVLVSGALVLLTTILHRTTMNASDAVESVLLAEETEIDLLLHERSNDPILKRATERDLRRKLEEARRFVSSED